MSYIPSGTSYKLDLPCPERVTGHSNGSQSQVIVTVTYRVTVPL